MLWYLKSVTIPSTFNFTIKVRFLLEFDDFERPPPKIPKKEEPSDAQKALGAIVALAAIAWLIASDWDGDSPGGGGSDGETVIVKDYKLSATVTVKAINESEPYKSSLRVNFGGSERKRSIKFFREFFTAIDKSLFLDESIEDLS